MSVLFHASDLHFGAEDQGALDAFACAVRDSRPDAVVITGDLTMRARHREFAAAADWLGSLGVPLSIEVGNHDIPFFNLWARFISPYRRYEQLETAIEQPLNLVDAAIVPLRTTARAQVRLNWAQGHVKTERLTTAVAALEAVPEGHVRIVACHHPLSDASGSRTGGRTRGGHAALGMLAAAGADIVLSGHVHDPFDIVWNDGERSVRMVGAGTLSERVRATKPSFNRIEINGGTISVAPQLLD